MSTPQRPDDPSSGFDAWWHTPLGRRLADAEQRTAATLLERAHGEVGVQVGHVASLDLLGAGGIARIVRLAPRGQPVGAPCGVQADPEALPFAGNRVAVVALPHVLEFSAHPHQVLREARRALVPEGHLLITGFNPISLMGLRRLAGPRRQPPWCGRFISLHRLKDWLQLLEFELTGGCAVLYRPPLQRERIQQKLDFLESMGNRWWPMMAGVYMVTAQKREAAMTPLVPAWKKKRSLAPGLARPIARMRGA